MFAPELCNALHCPAMADCFMENGSLIQTL